MKLSNLEKDEKEAHLGFLCPYCNTILTKENITKDHVIPKTNKRVRRKRNICFYNNILFCCFDCNQKKSNKSLLHFLGYLK